MTVFKAFLKILKKNKTIIIIYTAMLILFGGLNMTSDEIANGFEESKPDVYIVNNDTKEGITKSFINYIDKNTNIKDLKNNIDDALFYQDIDYIIYIPKNYNQDFLNGLNPKIEIKKSTAANSSYADMLVKRYLEIANIYQKELTNTNEITTKIENVLDSDISIKLNSKLDTKSLSKSSFYFNFESYSITACLIYVICLIIATFNDENIRKRNIISSTNYKKINYVLLLSNALLAFTLWLIYLIMAYFLIGDIILSKHGFIYAINSLVFTICALSLAFLISNIITKKEAINGVVNVIAIGSSFLCGAFVPATWLPDFVLTIGHALPTYYYINTNDRLTTLENFTFESLQPIIINMLVLVIFSIAFIVIANIVSRNKRKIG